MEIRILEKEEQQSIYDDAYKMLEAADNEFVPPLSSRSSSTQRNFSENSKSRDGIRQYFEQLKNQRFAVAYEDGALIAFVSYKENYCCTEISQKELPNIYISTLIVSPSARGKGVTKALYGRLFSEYENVNIFTRTWSTNIAHIKILEKYGFEVIQVIKNDRGNGIDTVYFKKAHK
jgi:ribosomal protein S18 acetylase RimI-like enzyme